MILSDWSLITALLIALYDMIVTLSGIRECFNVSDGSGLPSLIFTSNCRKLDTSVHLSIVNRCPLRDKFFHSHLQDENCKQLVLIYNDLEKDGNTRSCALITSFVKEKTGK